MKIAHINKNNQLLGWYDKEIHSAIPTPNIEVTEEQWLEAINSGHNKVNADGTTELFDFRTEEQIALYNSTQYIRDRQAEYPSITDQLDMQYWDTINGTTVWKDTIDAIKAKYPKLS
jgi:hypothetical protein